MSGRGLPLKTKIGYGAAELSNSLTWTMFYVLFLFFLTDVVKMDPAYAGFIMMTGTVWDAFSSPLVGVISDRVKSKWGRRRPFILGTAVPFGLITWLLFTDFGLSPDMTKAYFIAVVICTFTVFSFLDIPLTSLAAEMTQDYDERTSLISYRAVFSQVASITGAALPFVLVEHLTKTLGAAKPAWSVMTAFIGLFTIFPILITWRATRGTELYPGKHEHLHKRHKKRRLQQQDIQIYGRRLHLQQRGLRHCGSSHGLFHAVLHAVYGDAEIDRIPVPVRMHDRMDTADKLLLRQAFKNAGRSSYLSACGPLSSQSGAILVRPGDTVYFYVLVILASGGLIGVTMAGWAMIPDVSGG